MRAALRRLLDRLEGTQPDPPPGVYLSPRAQQIVDDTLQMIRQRHGLDDGITAWVTAQADKDNTDG